MRILKTILVALLLGGILILSISCGSNSSSASTSTTKTATVQKGNLSASITGTGNLAYSTTKELAFEMAGYVESVSVSAGDTVTKGEELAKLDVTQWDKQVAAYQKALETANRDLSAKQIAVTKAQRAVTTAQRTVVEKQAAVTAAQRIVVEKQAAVQQAQLDLQTAQYNLSQIADIKAAQDAVDSTKSNLDMARALFAVSNGNISTADVMSYQQQYDDAVARLQKIERGADTTISTSVALQVAQDQLSILQYQMALENAQTAVTDAGTAVTDAQTAVSDAQTAIDDANIAVTNAQLDEADAEQAVKDAQSDLDDANSLSPTITAPYDGIITKVNVSGGEEVYKGSVAVAVADPSQFEADILVTEHDISSVKLGGEATVSLDALSDITYPAKITYISPTATVSSGVVNYSVTVELTSLTPISTTQSTASQTASQPPTGAMPSVTPPSGSQLQGTLPAGVLPSTTPSTTSSQATAATPASTSTNETASSGTSTSTGTSQTVTLKDGLSATVEIISEQANNVLIVPDKAIKQQGQNYTVQVVKGTTTETRIVKIGMSDGTNTEIISGLSEGEQVVYTVSSSSSSSSSSTSKTNTVQGIPGLAGGGPPGGGF
jgi:HlyD family secretion protein